MLLWGDWAGGAGSGGVVADQLGVMVVFVAMLGCGCRVLLGGGVLLDGVGNLLFVVSCCWLC